MKPATNHKLGDIFKQDGRTLIVTHLIDGVFYAADITEPQIELKDQSQGDA